MKVNSKFLFLREIPWNLLRMWLCGSQSPSDAIVKIKLYNRLKYGSEDSHHKGLEDIQMKLLLPLRGNIGLSYK
jgi:hypothetical protein